MLQFWHCPDRQNEWCHSIGALLICYPDLAGRKLKVHLEDLVILVVQGDGRDATLREH